MKGGPELSRVQMASLDSSVPNLADGCHNSSDSGSCTIMCAFYIEPVPLVNPNTPTILYLIVPIIYLVYIIVFKCYIRVYLKYLCVL